MYQIPTLAVRRLAVGKCPDVALILAGYKVLLPCSKRMRNG
jgi:hypothetical protein